jgi:hypothetical protein
MIRLAGTRRSQARRPPSRRSAPTDDGIELLTLVPAALRGVGVLHRLRRHGLYELDGSGRAVVAAALQHDYGTNATAARRMTAWHDIGIATLLG